MAGVGEASLIWQIVRVDLVWHQQDMKYQA